MRFRRPDSDSRQEVDIGTMGAMRVLAVKMASGKTIRMRREVHGRSVAAGCCMRILKRTDNVHAVVVTIAGLEAEKVSKFVAFESA